MSHLPPPPQGRSCAIHLQALACRVVECPKVVGALEEAAILYGRNIGIDVGVAIYHLTLGVDKQKLAFGGKLRLGIYRPSVALAEVIDTQILRWDNLVALRVDKAPACNTPYKATEGTPIIAQWAHRVLGYCFLPAMSM